MNTNSHPWALLGGVRFVLAAIVVADHLRWFVSGPLTWPNQLGSFAAVLGFLLISGYSIAASLERAPDCFYRRRLRRIYPTYVIALALAVLPYMLAAGDLITPRGVLLPRPTLWQVAGNALLLQGFAVPVVSSDSALWSLSVECACYALAPLLWRLRSAFILPLGAASFAFFVVCRGPLGLPHYSQMAYGAAFASLLWAWLGGFMLYRHRTSAIAQGLIVLAGPLAFALNRSDVTRLSVVTLTASALALVLASDVHMPKSIARVLSRLGDVSYPLYLLHLPVLLILAAAL